MTEENNQITLQDIDAVVRIIDTVCARGAIRGQEMTAVGALREKFGALLQAEADKQQAAAEAAGPPAAPPEEVQDVAVEDVVDADLSTLN
jgi:hypothetical protein|tara:strand:- start:1552 stop:1821 length:270 start_codon:yes stop_codon:yes gene_type:complete